MYKDAFSTRPLVTLADLAAKGFRAERDGGLWYGLTPGGAERICEELTSRADVDLVFLMLANRRLAANWSFTAIGGGATRYDIARPGKLTATLWTQPSNQHFPYAAIALAALSASPAKVRHAEPLTPAEAFIIASQWGSFNAVGDPGGCFYAFSLNDARPRSESHRQQCLAWISHCRAGCDPADIDELDRLEAFFKTALIINETPPG
jgi:hypothetical protein